MKTNREVWIDGVKIFACVLVVLGHFFQSMVGAEILTSSKMLSWFIKTIYYFHVPLFFICSGYLYQKTSCVTKFDTWKKNVVKKALSLGIPYFVFSLITWLLKAVFSGVVNNQEDGLLKTLFLEPTSPYWYLYILFFVFAITPTFRNKKMGLAGLTCALFLKILVIKYGEDAFSYAVAKIMVNEIWFVIGMVLNVFEIGKVKRSIKSLYLGVISAAIFVAASIFVFAKDVKTSANAFLMGLVGCTAVLFIMIYLFQEDKQRKLLPFFSKYTMPVFLMHTIFAAGFRGVLIKLEIMNPVSHIIIGLLASFICPIVAFEIMQKLRLDILVYPGKYIKFNKS